MITGSADGMPTILSSRKMETAVCQNNGTISTNTKKTELIHQTLIAGNSEQEYDKSHLRTPKNDPAITFLSCMDIKD
jgi:hypothetical protein